MADLCPKGIDLGATPLAPSCPPTLLDEMAIHVRPKSNPLQLYSGSDK